MRRSPAKTFAGTLLLLALVAGCEGGPAAPEPSAAPAPPDPLVRELLLELPPSLAGAPWDGGPPAVVRLGLAELAADPAAEPDARLAAEALLLLASAAGEAR